MSDYTDREEKRVSRRELTRRNKKRNKNRKNL